MYFPLPSNYITTNIVYIALDIHTYIHTSLSRLLLQASNHFTAQAILPTPFMSGRPLPKFGEWDVNDPASAEGFTVIFNKARDEKKTGGKPDSPTRVVANTREEMEPLKPQGKKWFCCM
ncbi:hypothetical protein ACS0TY_016841 [Phlomoides rotata]